MVRKNTLFVISILLILILSLTFTSAITGAMGNAKMILRPEVNGWTNTIIEKSILVKNVNNVPINVTLEVDEDSKDFIELIDNFYQLQPGTEERAQFIIKVRKEGTYNGKINVYFRDSVNERAPGVALSSEIIIIAKKDQGYNEIDDDEDNTNQNEDKNNSAITGSIVDNITDLKVNPTAVVIGSSLVLLIVLLILLSIMAKKKKKVKVNGNKKK